jgi:NitT/TauT family transport system substrate-binding protein
VAEDLLRGEGFGKVEYVKMPTDNIYQLLGSGEADFSMADAPSWVMGVDAGVPLVVLSGIHPGCYDLFAKNEIRSISDLRGKSVAVAGAGRRGFVASMAAQVGLDPRRDIKFVELPSAEGMRQFEEGKVDAFLGFPPEPRELRAKKIGHVVVSTLTDRPWSSYFCCMVGANRQFVEKNPAATRRALRALLKAANVCALDPDKASRFLVDRGYMQDFEAIRDTVKGLPYTAWRDYSAEDTLRFYALRLHEAGMIRSSPQKIIAQGTDWRFLNALKKELKG